MNKVDREKVAKTVLEVVRARAEGATTHKQIAKRLGIHLRTVHRRLAYARTIGLIGRDDEIEQLIRNELRPQVVENLRTWLNKGDKATTLASAGGLGVFVPRSEQHSTGHQVTVLRIEYTTADGTPLNLDAPDPPGVVGTPIQERPSAVDAELGAREP